MEIALIALSILSISLLISYLSVSKKLKVVSESFSKLFLLHNKTLDSRTFFNEKDQDVHTQNFIKFLSDSRDWAFQYIEDVQIAIKKFIAEVEPEIEQYNKFGVVVEGMVRPHDIALKKISKEFEDLKKLLPEDTSDRR